MSFKLSLISLVASLLASIPIAQASEEYPSLPTWKCTSSAGCVQQNTSIVLDTVAKLAQGAAGSRTAADYAAMGVSTSGTALTLYHYVKSQAASLRVYLLGDDRKYVLMSLLNGEFSVNVDLSDLPCGENGAFYLSEMAADGSGGTGSGDAGAGNGYCDAQCQGYCCNEMDILEANSQATAMTPHPCKGSTCDRSGRGYNPYASGQKGFWGPGKTVDSSKNGKQIGGGGTISSCGSESSTGGLTGGLTGMGQALQSGMVLAMSIWNDATQQMAWLDAGTNGPCASGADNPSNIQSQHPDTHVVFSNIR